MTENENSTGNPLAPNWADQTREDAYRRFVGHLNSVSFSVLAYYPESEVHSWDIQKAEAERVIAAGDEATLADAPFLTLVCKSHFLIEDEDELLMRLKEKAEIVHANAQAWAMMAAWINGTRVRYQEAFATAQNSDEVLDLMYQAFDEVDRFKRAHNL